MTSCRHHSGYLADDEAGHTTYVARVLDSLQTVVEEATERMITMKTEAGVPLVEVQDPIEVPRGRRQKGLGQTCFRRDSLLWDSLGSQASSQWTQEPPLSWFSGLLGSSSGTPQTSELGLGEQELVFLKEEFNKEIKSLLSQPASFDLPGYCSFREPHRTLDFLAEHHLFPALQKVVSQAVDKLSGARRHDGCPLFPSEWEPTTKPNSDSVDPGSKPATPTDKEEPYDMLPTRAFSPKMVRRKSTKDKGRAKFKEGGSPMSSAQVATRFRLEVTPTEEPKVPSPRPRQEAPDQDQTPPIHASGPLSFSQKAQPWRSLHLTLPAPGIVVEGPSRQIQPTTQGAVPLTSPCPRFSHHLPMFSPLASSSPNYKLMKKKPLPSISSNSTMSHLSNPLYQDLINYLVEQVVSLLICKYKFEKNLSKQLGFISFPVTETLMDLFLGFKKVKGSHICLSSKIDWSCLLRKLEEAQWAQEASQHDSASRRTSASRRSSPFQRSSHRGTAHRGTAHRGTAHRGTAHRGTAHHGTAHQGVPPSHTESPSTLPEPPTQEEEEEDSEPSLHSQLLDPQLLPAQEDTAVEEKEPKSQEEPRPSTFSVTDRGSSRCQEVVDMNGSQGDEEEEDEVNDDDFFGDQGKPQSSSDSQVEDDHSSYSRDVGHSDPP
ncbi:coiled-coil domain-containing protein 116 isoform X3 [Crocuta crocuta]